MRLTFGLVRADGWPNGITATPVLADRDDGTVNAEAAGMQRMTTVSE